MPLRWKWKINCLQVWSFNGSSKWKSPSDVRESYFSLETIAIKTFVSHLDADLLIQSNFWTMFTFAYCRNATRRWTRSRNVEPEMSTKKIRQFESEFKFKFNVEKYMYPHLARTSSHFVLSRRFGLDISASRKWTWISHACCWTVEFRSICFLISFVGDSALFISCVLPRTVNAYRHRAEYFASCLCNFFFVLIFFVSILWMRMQTVKPQTAHITLHLIIFHVNEKCHFS